MHPLPVPEALVAFAVLAIVGGEGVKASMPLECRLEAVPTHPAGGPVLVRFVLRNPGRQDVSVLNWQTPLEGLLGDIFDVRPKGGGDALRYEGPLVKRGDPEPDEYVRIPAGGEVLEEVDLASAYDLARPGRYSVAFRGPLRDVTDPSSAPRPRERHRAVPVACNALEIEILPRAAR